MSTYKEIIGKKIKKVTSDPSNSVDGQMWYNSTTGTIRGLGIVEAWVSGSLMNAARKGLGAGGTSTTGLAFGGNGDTNATEEYNGSGWSTGGDLSQVRLSTTGCGPSSAGLCVGGNIPPVTNATEEYDGSSWTAVWSFV